MRSKPVRLPAEQFDALVGDAEHVRDHRVEKFAVVRDQQQRAGIALEPVFEPEHGVEIEVVGRLVEQQQVGAAHQRLGQIQAHAPAAGEFAHRRAFRRPDVKPRPCSSSPARARAA